MHAQSSPPAVTMEKVSKRFGAVDAVRGVPLEIAEGEMFGLIGPDGAGKTTTIRLLCGLLHPDSGRIQVLGRNPERQHRALTNDIGYFSQRFSLYGDLSIDENIAFFAEIHGVRDYQARRTRLLDMMQLTPFRHRLAERLSGGMKQKLALACTLVHGPRLILLDEPTTGVDPVSRREFWRLLSEFLAEGITIVMATPYLDEAERCGRVALVSDGQVLALDTPPRLRDSFPGDLVEVLAHPQTKAAEILDALDGIEGLQEFGERLHAQVALGAGADAATRIRSALEARGLSVTSARPVPASLEDVFITRVTQGPASAEVSS
jgi:ABC-2 type transport system ATP-binding protein